MISYLTKQGNLVFHYSPGLDDYYEAEKQALIKHNILDKKTTTIGVTRQTDFIKKDAIINQSKALTANSFGFTPPPGMIEMVL